MELQIYYYENLLSLKIRLFAKIFHYENLELSRRSCSPAITGTPDHLQHIVLP